jgi:formate dehydrogenase major subunit
VVKNPIYPKYQYNPVADKMERPDNPYAQAIDDRRFPYVATTYRLTEHHTAGGMTRQLTHLAELQPEMFCEISPEFANQLGVINGDWVTITSPRGIISAKALVTNRVQPLQIDGRSVHTVGLPYHWGWKGLAKGQSSNDLVAISEDPNVRIMESKAFVCNVVAGRVPDDEALNTLKQQMRKTA